MARKNRKLAIWDSILSTYSEDGSLNLRGFVRMRRDLDSMKYRF